MGSNGFSCSHYNMTLENPTRVSMLQVGPVRGVIGLHSDPRWPAAIRSLEGVRPYALAFGPFGPGAVRP